MSDGDAAIIGSRVGVGRTAEIFDAGNNRVIKLLRPGFAEAILEEEAAISTIVAARYPAAPQCMGLVRVGGRLGILYERIRGPSMDARVRARLWEADRHARELGTLHAAMHQRTGEGLGGQFAALHAAVERAGMYLPAAAVAAARAQIDRLATGTSLCHGDLHPGNVLLGERTVVIDWGNATIGNAAADVARTLFLLRDVALLGGARAPWHVVIDSIRARIARTYLAAYRAARTLDLSEVAAWRLPILVARMAEGISAEQVALQREIEIALRAPEYLASR